MCPTHIVTIHPNRLPPPPCYLQDGEELLVEIGQCLRQCRAERLDREATLFRLAIRVEGVYVPQFYDAPQGWVGCCSGLQAGCTWVPCMRGAGWQALQAAA